jgi:hypothetical protein
MRSPEARVIIDVNVLIHPIGSKEDGVSETANTIPQNRRGEKNKTASAACWMHKSGIETYTHGGGLYKLVK